MAMDRPWRWAQCRGRIRACRTWASRCVAGRVVIEPAGLADRVAMGFQAPGGQVVGIRVNADQPSGTGCASPRPERAGSARRRSDTSGHGPRRSGCDRPRHGSPRCGRPTAGPGAGCRPGGRAHTGRAVRSPARPGAPGLMLTSPSGATRIVSFPLRFPDSPSAWRNQRSASHRRRPRASVSCAVSRWCRVRSSLLPPRTTRTRPTSHSARSRSSRSPGRCRRRNLAVLQRINVLLPVLGSLTWSMRL